MNKKINKHFKKTTVILLILSIFTTPFFGVSRIYAQQSGGSETSGGYNSGGAYPTGNQVTGGIGAYIEVLGPAIQELPLCKDKIATSGIKGLFQNQSATIKTEDIFGSADSKVPSNDFNTSEGIPVYTDRTDKKIDVVIKAQTTQTKSLSALEENDTCLKSIGRMVVKMLLQKITVSTVEWINNGFEGKPLFLQNSGKFFGDIAKNEILQFRLEIDNPTLYPFGRDFLKSQIGVLNNRFAQNARYSANELIQRTTPEYSSTTFSTTFAQGGWNAWTALTQVPANNPIGFNIIASNELSLRLEGTSSSTAEKAQTALDQSSGFLGDERCAEPQGITREQHRAALIKGEREMEEYEDVELDQYGDETVVTKKRPTGKVVGLCERWEYVTPGKLISEAATKVVNYPDNNLLRADDLNSAIASIMDALLNRWSQDLANKGFASFSNDGASGGFILDGDNRTTGAVQQVSLDFPKTAINSNWLRENPTFNIRTDLTQAVIDEQRIYQRKILEQNQVLGDLVTTVYQLDYCIPGPHPGFAQDSETILASVKNAIPSKSPSDFEDIDEKEIKKIVQTAGQVVGVVAAAAIVGTGTKIGAAIGSIIPGAGTIVGAAIGAAIGAIIYGLTVWLDGKSNEEKLDFYYAGIMIGMSGIHLSKSKTETAKITSKQDVTNALDTMLERYVKLINKYYTKDFLPTVTPAARIEFRKVPGYGKTIENNEYASSALDGIIVRLAKLKDDLDKLNPNVNSYTDYLPLINEFSRLSSSMVTGNDIAKVVDDNKEYSSQIKYIYEDLLTGPYGCEKDLQEERQEPKSGSGANEFKLRQTLRAEYPFAVWYDYNLLKKDDPIPVPEALRKYGIKSPAELRGEANLMPPYEIGVPIPPRGTNLAGQPHPEMSYGPGFLSSVAMNWSKPQDWPKPASAEKEGCQELINNHHDYKSYTLDCLLVGDLFFHVNQWPVSVGKNHQGIPLSGETGENINRQKDSSFEQTIGIY